MVKAICDITKEFWGVTSPAYDVIQGVIVGLIHHTQANTFTDIQDTIYAAVDKLATERNGTKLHMGGRLLYVMFTVQKGVRISAWETGAELLLKLLDSANLVSDDTPVEEIIKASAVLLQTASMDIVIQKGAKIVERIQNYEV